MRMRSLRKLMRSEPVRAVIISDGCRDYVVEIHRETGAGVLTDGRGKPKRFTSLAEAKRAVRHASEITLAMRVAADEACAGHSSRQPRFSMVPLASRAA